MAAKGVWGHASPGNFLIVDSKSCIFLEDTTILHGLITKVNTNFPSTNSLDHMYILVSLLQCGQDCHCQQVTFSLPAFTGCAGSLLLIDASL